MSKPEYIPSLNVTTAKAKVKRSYQLLEQEINGLDSFVRTIKGSVESLSESYNTESGINTKKELMKKIESIENSVYMIQSYLHAMGGTPNIETEKGQFNETKIYQG